MAKVPWCIANSCVIPRHTAKECENKNCPHLVYVCENDRDFVGIALLHGDG